MLKEFIETNLPDKNLIVVSNREPYIHKKSDAGIKVERPAGGLTSAMDDVLRVTGGLWVAWGSGSGDRDTVDERSCVQVPPDESSYLLKRIWLSPEEVDNYYHGYSNHLLWPLCHMTLDKIYFRKKFWEDYQKVNRAFARGIVEEAGEDSIVWVHDFHLSLLPKILRDERPAMTIAHFWHTPWPPWSIFRICPQAVEIIEGMLGNDLIGFQIPQFVDNFIHCVKENFDAKIDYENAIVEYKGHITKLKAFPISVDYDKFDTMASSARTVRMIPAIRDKYGLNNVTYLGVGVDRLEYTKGLIKRLEALDLFFERYPDYREKFTFIQIAVPTRMQEPYLSYKRMVEELVSKLNKRFAVNGWRPVIYMDRKVDHKDLVAFYRMADVAVISSIYDGMNLVAKEYVASQTDVKGALILSELAGAAEELEGSLLVNPYDIEGFSDCIKRSLDMDSVEKWARMKILRSQTKENDIYKWISDILLDMALISTPEVEQGAYLFDMTEEVRRRTAAQDVVLFLDFDGTLTPIVETPDKAVLNDEMRGILTKLKENLPLVVISGRGLKDIRERIGIENIMYAGNHGSEIWDDGAIINHIQPEENPRELRGFLSRLKKKLSRIQGVYIEDKGVTASIHFRLVNPKYLSELFEIFRKIAKDYEGRYRITHGKKVLEIRPLNAWNKGDAVNWIMEKSGKEKMPIYIGDDITDEDAFRVIKGKGICISIGKNPEAEYYLKDQGEVKDFLEWVLKKT